MDDDDDNWDLQAVVRGCSRAATAASDQPPCSSSPAPFLHRAAAAGDTPALRPQPFEELQAACRPFFFGSPLQELERTVSSSFLGRSQQPKPRPLPHAAARSKRRKSQVKKVVCQVPADGVSSDAWAWRKYGQKPIKGSPFPRGYYRCSSSKGCPARKLVERSSSDPSSFIVTYTAEHNHPAPSHRSCLAGSTRSKATPSPSQRKDSSSSSLSPTTPLVVSGGEEEEEDVELLMGLSEELEDGICFSPSTGVIDFGCCSC